MPLLQIHAHGAPYAIGLAHGREAQPLVRSTKAFYESFLTSSTQRTWPQILALAAQWAPFVQRDLPHLWDEMRGVADGACLEVGDVLALNCRTEIGFGLFGDGCTTCYALNAESPLTADGTDKTNPGPLQGQNWDWNPEQSANLVRLRITPASGPNIDMITEAGLIGKIGLNSHGVAVCLNALRAPGADPARIPAHLALRLALESPSRAAAVERLGQPGVASASYILIGDAAGASGLENSASTQRAQALDARGLLAHSNHMLLDHGAGSDGVLALARAGKLEQVFWPDTVARQPRALELLVREAGESGVVSLGAFEGVFRDGQGAPCAISRVCDGRESQIATLFNVVFRLRERRGDVTLGRPGEGGERVELGDWF